MGLMSDEPTWTNLRPTRLEVSAQSSGERPLALGRPPLHPAPATGAPLAGAPLPGTRLPGAPARELGWEGSPAETPRRAGGLRKRVASALAAIVALAAKFGAALKALLIALPNLKLLATMGTAMVSVAAYSLFFGWRLAAGFVVLLFVHEMGHVIQIRREGLHASMPMFVPFLGAFIAARSLGENALAEARVGIAGPILGSLGAAAVAVAGALLHSDLLLAMAYLGFFINLFNLIPVVPFDGGRVMAAVAPGLWFLGIAGLVAMVFLLHSPFGLLFILLALMEMPRRWRQLRSRTLVSAAYYRVPRRSRVAFGLLYIGLIIALALGMNATHILATGGHSFTSL
jgi:Zn-dependent protease